MSEQEIGGGGGTLIETHNGRLLIEPLSIGEKLQLTAISIDHDHESWNQHGPEIVSLLNKVDLLFPEYFPFEYLEEVNTNMATRACHHLYKSRTEFFQPLMDECQRLEKEVWVLDPAYNFRFLAVRAGTIAPFATLNLALYTTILKRLQERGPMTRRKFLKILGLGGADVIVRSTATALGLNPAYETENDFRRVLVARGLNELAKNLSTSQTGLIVYPPDHWEGIKSYIQQPKMLDQRYRLYALAKDVDYLEPLFHARHYIPTSQGWKPAGKLKI